MGGKTTWKTKILLPVVSVLILVLTCETLLSVLSDATKKNILSHFYFKKGGLISPYRFSQDNSKLVRKPIRNSEILPGALIVPQKNSTAQYELKQVTGETVYNVSYKIDNYRRRVTPGQMGPRNKHALFMGCSIAYGEGSNDNETIPFFFAQNAQDFRAYNFAYHGYGIQDILARARYKGEDYWEGVREEEGVGIYLFMYDHIRRLLGSMSYLSWYGPPHPYLKEMPDGQIVNMGSFRDNRPLLIKIYKFIYERALVKSLDLDLPLVGQSEWKFFAKVVNEVKKEYLTRFPRGKFIVFLMPRLGQEISTLRNYLSDLGIENYDYSDHRLEDLVAQKTYLNPDSHLTPAANRYMGKLMANTILSGTTRITTNDHRPSTGHE